MTDVLIVGGGLLGASTAYHLIGKGASVAILEAGEPGSGTSGSSFAWINAQDKKPMGYFDLNRQGLLAYPALAATLGGSWFHPGGDLLIGHERSIEAVQEKADRHAALGYPVTRLDRAEIQALEPDLRLPDGDLVGAHFSAEAWIDASAFIARLIETVTAAGSRFVRGTAEAIIVDGERVTGVRCRDGTVESADQVVLAAGPATEALAATAGVRLPMAPSPGLLVTMPTVKQVVRRVIHTGDVALRPDGAGRVLVASRAVDAGLDPATRALGPTDPPVSDVVERALPWLPHLAGAQPEQIRIGIRSVASDGQPAVGRVDRPGGLYLLVSHSGATLAPVLGDLVAEELTGVVVPALEAYRPGRFAATS